MHTPTANFTFECLPKNHGLCTLDASGSHPSESGEPINEYVWGFSDTPDEFESGVTAQHQFTENGWHIITLRVTDSAGNVDYRQRSVQVKAVKGGG